MDLPPLTTVEGAYTYFMVTIVGLALLLGVLLVLAVVFGPAKFP